jgi:ubiquinone/menaquinone biosynthesis C-methylase UbiE
METRGEKTYIHMPVLAARLYNRLTNVRGVNKGFEDIANYLDTVVSAGKILDVGTGPGRLLVALHKKNTNYELFGLDISESMLKVAAHHLKGIPDIRLQVGNIAKTDYPDDFFDVIVSSGSFYNWDSPTEGLNEIHRILKPGKTAYIFETYKEYDKPSFEHRLAQNLKGYNLIKRKTVTRFLLKQLSMTYGLSEFEDIAARSEFKNDHRVVLTELGNLPIYVRLELKKH